MTLFINDWNITQKYIPYINDLRTMRGEPFRFYGGVDADYICVRNGDNIYLPGNYPAAVTALNQKMDKIQALGDKADWVLIDFHDEPGIIYNCTTNRVYAALYDEPIQRGNMQILVFNSKNECFKTGLSKAIALYMVSQAMYLVSNPAGRTTLAGQDMFIDFFKAQGFQAGYLRNDEVGPYLIPRSRIELLTSQTSEFLRATRKNIQKGKKTYSAAKNRASRNQTITTAEAVGPNGKYLLSKLLNFIPTVSVRAPVELDFDVTEQGITEMWVTPGLRFDVYVKLDATHDLDKRLDQIEEMLGHSKFTVYSLTV